MTPASVADSDCEDWSGGDVRYVLVCRAACGPGAANVEVDVVGIVP
jgi:hypothetical protein